MNVLTDLLTQFLNTVSSSFDLNSLDLLPQYIQLLTQTQPPLLQKNLTSPLLKEGFPAEPMYQLTKTPLYLQKALEINSLENLSINSYFLSTYVLDLGLEGSLLPKGLIIAHCINLILESFNLNGEGSQNQLKELVLLVSNGQVGLIPLKGSIYSEEQLKKAFLTGFSKVLSLRAKPHISFTKLARSFAFITFKKPVFLESLVVFLKGLLLLNITKGFGSFNRENLENNWFEPKKEFFQLVSHTLNRGIDVYEIKERGLEQIGYKPEEKRGSFMNKISVIITGEKTCLVLNISEKECFERLDVLSKEEQEFLEDDKPAENVLENWRKNNKTLKKLKETIDIMNTNYTEKMNYLYIIEKTPINQPNLIEYKENIIPGSNKVERIALIDRTREKSRSKSPLIYYNQYSFDNRGAKQVYTTGNQVIVDNRVRRHYTTNNLPNISNNINMYGYN